MLSGGRFSRKSLVAGARVPIAPLAMAPAPAGTPARTPAAAPTMVPAAVPTTAPTMTPPHFLDLCGSDRLLQGRSGKSERGGRAQGEREHRGAANGGNYSAFKNSH